MWRISSLKEYALKLETAFRVYDSIPVSADDFQSNYYSALENGLEYLLAQGIISSTDINRWMEEYGFANLSLNEIILDSAKKDALDEMLKELDLMRNNQKVEE